MEALKEFREDKYQKGQKKKKGALQGQRSWRMNDLYPFSIFLLLTETLSTPWLGESGTP